jgi:hypothetical protein
MGMKHYLRVYNNYILIRILPEIAQTQEQAKRGLD